MTSLSIAMCTYNGSLFLEEQLDSIVSQSRRPDELVVCDDNSQDRTIRMLEDFSRSSPFPVRIIRNSQNLGYRRNFISAASLCEGDLVAFCDQDDVWHPHKIERSMEPFEDARVVLSYHPIDLIDQDGRKIGELNTRTPGQKNSPPLTISPWIFGLGFTLTFRRSLTFADTLRELSLDQNDTSKPLAHDQWYCFLASVLGTTAYVDERLAQYRQHSSNLFGAFEKQDGDPSAKTYSSVKAKEFGACALSSRHRSLVLDKMSALASPFDAEIIAAGAARYEKLAEHFEKRKKFYASHSMVARIAAIASMLRSGAYSDDKPWSFGRKAILRDVGNLLRA